MVVDTKNHFLQCIRNNLQGLYSFRICTGSYFWTKKACLPNVKKLSEMSNPINSIITAQYVLYKVSLDVLKAQQKWY